MFLIGVNLLWEVFFILPACGISFLPGGGELIRIISPDQYKLSAPYSPKLPYFPNPDEPEPKRSFSKNFLHEKQAVLGLGPNWVGLSSLPDRLPGNVFDLHNFKQRRRSL
jgi:hypothetical protein